MLHEHTSSSSDLVHPYLLVHLRPRESETAYAGGAQGYGDVEGAVHVVVLMAGVGYLDEVLDHCGTLGWCLPLQDLRGNPACHLNHKATT